MLMTNCERLPTQVPCTFCGAGSGSWCRNGYGKARFPVHGVRLKAWREYLKEKSKFAKILGEDDENI
jgi:hypothetical protein